MGFGRGGTYNNEQNGQSDVLHGRVATIKTSPEKGKKRIIVKTKTGMRNAVGIDVEAKDAAKVKRKQDYTFQVKEKNDDRFGTRPKAGGFKTYSSDEAPQEYCKEYDNGFKKFGENSNMKSGKSRTRF